MSSIPVELRRQVIERATNRCEYCGIAQSGQEATFHVDHIQPRAEGGATVLENLALACVSCSLRKSARTQALDPDTGETAPIFHPRQSRWNEHFQNQGEWIVGVTPTGRATVALLKMNRPVALAIRSAWMSGGGQGA